MRERLLIRVIWGRARRAAAREVVELGEFRDSSAAGVLLVNVCVRMTVWYLGKHAEGMSVLLVCSIYICKMNFFNYKSPY